VRNILIDAGPLIALFASDDKHHAHYDRLVSELSADGLRLVTTWPCVVEASHLLDPPFRYELLEWVQLGGVAVYPFDVFHLNEMVDWMRQYTERYKREMDFADASLVWLANETGIEEIMTIDNKDFTRYRLPDGRALSLL
jgi:predicted nucleic acid-binding protein